MARTEFPVMVPWHPRRCTWCGGADLVGSLALVAEGFVFHAVCYDGQEGEGLCAECGYLLGVNLHPERTPSCRCATIVYDEDGYHDGHPPPSASSPEASLPISRWAIMPEEEERGCGSPPSW